MTKNRAKYGYLSYNDMLTRILNGKLDAYDIVYTTDTKESFVITPELEPIAIKSKVYVFNDITEATTILNENTDTYVGQLVSILIDETYKGYIVNQIDGMYTVTPLSESGGVTDYNTLGNKPILNIIGTLDDPIVISDLDGGIYSIKGRYKIATSDITTYINPNPNLFIVDKNENGIFIKKISSNEIIDYVVTDQIIKTNKIVTEEYLKENGYATTAYVDEKIAALDILVKEETDSYIASVVEEKVDAILDTKIDEEIDKKIQGASEEQINFLFNNN